MFKNYFKYKRNTFLKAVKKFEFEQEKVLFQIINDNKNTKYGKKYNFNTIKDIIDFQKNVPITSYENYKPYIDEILSGKNNILTKEKILLLEPTSGSTSATKYIPYTKSLKKAFNYGIEPWLSDLFLNYPDLLEKQMYWSITPNIKNEIIDTKIKIGFENDFEYLNKRFSDIFIKNIIIPPVFDKDTNEFQQKTADFLASHNNLGLISIWNPYLLILFINKIKNKPDKIWNNLSVISCWDDGNSKQCADILKQCFPNTYIQGKGLLATEGIVTIPIEKIGKLPCVKSHFFEFIDVQTNKIKLLKHLEIGKNYKVLITTQGGLYRYNLGDIINVYDKFNDCPMINFVGREESISDYFGEKLNENFVMSILDKYNIPQISNFYIFLPNSTEKKFNYVLYIEPLIQSDWMNIEKEIEEELLKSFHYNYARKLGQLKKFKICIMQNGMKQYMENCVQFGQKLGDIKLKNFSSCNKYNFIGKYIS